MIKFRKGGKAGKLGTQLTRSLTIHDLYLKNVCMITLTSHCWLSVAGATVTPSARSGPNQTQGSTNSARGLEVIVLPTIEDIHLPPRYQRRLIDQKEIEYINVS